MKKLRWLLEAALFFACSFPLGVLPESLADRLGIGFGRLAHALLGRRRRIALENVRQVMAHEPAARAWSDAGLTAELIVRQAFVNIGRTVMEACRLYYGRHESLIRRVEVRGVENYLAAKSRGKGVAFITGHCGNWELMALAFGVLHDPLGVVARKQDNPYLNRVLERVRSQYNNYVIYKSGALREMLTRFRRNENVGILIDQAVVPEEGVLIPFLGRTAWATKAPVVLARKSGVALVPGFMHREGERFVLEFSPAMTLGPGDDEAAILADCRRLAGYVEQYILDYPTEWYWIHNRWKRAGAPVESP